ncbi:cell division protein FtsA, partial [Priestia sp. SIMBA_032]
AESAITHAVHAAEQMAGETIREVIVNLSGGHPASQMLKVDVSIAGHAVSDGDLRRVLRAHSQAEVPTDGQVIHAIPIGYAIDGNGGIRDPRG